MAKRALVPGLAEKLQAARLQAGLSRLQAAERSGVHHVSIARFETGRRVPTLTTLYRLAAAYGLGAAELLPPPDPELRIP
ncbi:MAG TPA: helix-turn-helix transcriptional regulator [Urbifossiella sp.]|jgi:transcriptional regulator with XRE-family HTH domain|nr:helix-turn-helix transcriptional regulator [Urbifossiella sp.]